MAYDHPSTIDPDERRVVFDAGSHLHLAAKRPWLLDEIDTILDTVAAPTFMSWIQRAIASATTVRTLSPAAGCASS